jgi:hypothetical protein
MSIENGKAEIGDFRFTINELKEIQKQGYNYIAKNGLYLVDSNTSDDLDIHISICILK